LKVCASNLARTQSPKPLAVVFPISISEPKKILKGTPMKSSPLVYFKPTILYLAAYILTIIAHEFSHAIMANLVGIPAVVFPFYTNISRTIGSVTDKAMISITGPFVSLSAGLICLFLFRQAKNTGLKLFLLYAYLLGISIFLGNMFSASMAGDFNRFFNLLGHKLWVKIVVTAIGLLGSIAFMYCVGAIFTRFTISGQYSKKETIMSTIVLPWVLGTFIYIVILLPLPGELIMGIITSSIFWIFTIAGAWFYKIKSGEALLQLNKTTLAELIILMLCVFLIRMISHGVSLS
jgi:hypothetical protein